MRQEVGTKEETEMTEKGKLIVGEINMGRGPISLVPVDIGTVCGHGSPVDIETIPILESHVDTGTVHANVSMLTGVQIP